MIHMEERYGTRSKAKLAITKAASYGVITDFKLVMHVTAWIMDNHLKKGFIELESWLCCQWPRTGIHPGSMTSRHQRCADSRECVKSRAQDQKPNEV